MLGRRNLISGGLALLGGEIAQAAPVTLQPGTLTIGTYFVNPPFEFVQGGARIGYEVDLMHGVARRLGLKPVFVDTRWEVILQQMRAHLYDCIIGGITITPKRAETLAWSVPYLTTTLSLIVNTRTTPGITGLAGLRDATIGVQAATTDYDIAAAMQRKGAFGRIAVYPFDRIADAIGDLEAGRITAVMKVEPVAAYLARRKPDLKIIAQVPDDPQPLGIGFALDQTGLRTQVNAALAGMDTDGTLARLARHWHIAA